MNQKLREFVPVCCRGQEFIRVFIRLLDGTFLVKPTEQCYSRHYLTLGLHDVWYDAISRVDVKKLPNKDFVAGCLGKEVVVKGHELALV